MDPPEALESQESEHPKRGLYDSTSEDAGLPDDDASEEALSGTEEIRRSLRFGQRDEYDDDFVVDEGDDTLGAPDEEEAAALASIPIQFTRHAHKKPKEHFKDVVEWMVHNKLNPAFERNDPVYRVAIQRLDTHVQGYSNSKFTSSAWTSDFVRAFQARPNLFAHEIMTETGGRCEACNRSNHAPSWIVQFDGKPYQRYSLEAVADEDDNDTDDNESSDSIDKKSVDSQGRPVPNSNKKWAVGR